MRSEGFNGPVRLRSRGDPPLSWCGDSSLSVNPLETRNRLPASTALTTTSPKAVGGGDTLGASWGEETMWARRVIPSDRVDYALRLWGDVGTVGGEGRRVGQSVLPPLDRQITHRRGTHVAASGSGLV